MGRITYYKKAERKKKIFCSIAYYIVAYFREESMLFEVENQ